MAWVQWPPPGLGSSEFDRFARVGGAGSLRSRFWRRSHSQPWRCRRKLCSCPRPTGRCSSRAGRENSLSAPLANPGPAARSAASAPRDGNSTRGWTSGACNATPAASRTIRSWPLPTAPWPISTRAPACRTTAIISFCAIKSKAWKSIRSTRTCGKSFRI